MNSDLFQMVTCTNRWLRVQFSCSFSLSSSAFAWGTMRFCYRLDSRTLRLSSTSSSSRTCTSRSNSSPHSSPCRSRGHQCLELTSLRSLTTTGRIWSKVSSKSTKEAGSLSSPIRGTPPWTTPTPRWWKDSQPLTKEVKSMLRENVMSKSDLIFCTINLY